MLQNIFSHRPPLYNPFDKKIRRSSYTVQMCEKCLNTKNLNNVNNVHENMLNQIKTN